MNTCISRALAGILCAAMAATTAQASTTTMNLAAPGRNDLVPGTLQAARHALPVPASMRVASAPAMPPALDHTPVQVSWKLRATDTLQAAPVPFSSRSRSYWKDVSESEMRNGLSLPVTAPGAVIRLSPVGGDYGAIDPAKLSIEHAGRTSSAASASTLSANVRQLRAAGMRAPNGSLAVKLDAQPPAGPVTLKAADARGRYVVQVFEPDSPYALDARTRRDTVISGDAVTLDVDLRRKNAKTPIEAVGGFLLAPDGSTQTLDFHAHGDGFEAQVRPAAGHAAPGLWELHTFASAQDTAGHTVLRDAVTAFAVSVPDARLAGDARIARDSDGAVHVHLGVLAESASRYALGGVLYGQAADGSMQPVAYAQSAAWLTPGHGDIDLRFDASSLAGSTLTPPYELRDLRLKDQADMSLLERRGMALSFTP